MGANPTKPTLSQQASSEPEGDHQQVVSEAGCSEFAGRVLSPEICTVVVREDKPEVFRSKPTACNDWKAVVLHTKWQVC